MFECLEPTFEHGRPSDDRLEKMNRLLARLIDDVARPALNKAGIRIRYPDVTFLFEDAGPNSIWFPIPGMAGGFAIEVHKGRVHVDSWSRAVGGSGLYHVITSEQIVLVEEGFV